MLCHCLVLGILFYLVIDYLMLYPNHSINVTNMFIHDSRLSDELIEYPGDRRNINTSPTNQKTKENTTSNPFDMSTLRNKIVEVIQSKIPMKTGDQKNILASR